MSEGTFVAQIVLLLLVGRGLGEIMQRFGQPTVVGQLLAGLLLGPSLFGWVLPEAHDFIFPKSVEQKSQIAGLADIGILMLLLLTGMETDLKLVRKVGRPAIAVTTAGVAVPFLCGFALGEYLPQSLLPDPNHRMVAALFLGTALSISSIKIVAMVVRETNFTRRNIGQIIVASAIMEDTVGWIIVAITLGIAAEGGFAYSSFAKTLIGTALFIGFSYTLGRSLVFKLIRWVNDTFVSEYAVITAILLVMLLSALITQLIGVNAVLGAFVAGVLVGESPILSGHIEDQLRGFITAFLMPIFFGLSGLSADLTILKDPQLAALTVGLVVIASVGKFSGAFIGGRLSGLSAREALALGCGMNARGSTEVVVATIGLSMGALSQNLYTMIVTMAVITTMAMPPMLRWALVRLPIDAEEEKRLRNEEIDEKGFVSKFERLLVAADETANGKLVSQLAGFIAGHRGLPMTVLDIKVGRKVGRAVRSPKRDANESEVAEVAKDSAKISGANAEAENDEKPRAVEVIARIETDDGVAAIAKEAEKGFDLLSIGVGNMRDTQGAFSKEIEHMASAFPGPIALAIAGNYEPHEDVPRAIKIVIPVNGTEVSRRGAELAFALAPTPDTSITAIYVSDGGDPRNRNAAKERKAEKAVLDDVIALGRRYGFEIEAAIHLDEAPEDAIFDAAKRMKADLLVIGANRRAGSDLYLGKTVSALMGRWKGGIVIVAS